MSYYLDTQDKREAQKLADKNRCSECGRELIVFTDYKQGKYYLQCTANQNHEGIAKHYQVKRELNIPTRREIMDKQYGEGTSTALDKARIPTSGALTQSQAMHILKLVYPQVPEDEIVRCAILCRDFGLHPLLKEVYIIPFGQGDKRTWSTVIGINATRKMMAQRGTYSYLDNTPRVMTEEEQVAIFGKVDSENIKAITKLKSAKGMEAQGYGSWPKEKDPYGTDKGNSKANMAFIRSERNAFGRLFADAVPQGVEVIDEEYVELPDIGKVSKQTGEIIEGEVVEQGTEPDPLPETPEPQKKPAKEKVSSPTPIEQEVTKLAEQVKDKLEKDETQINKEQLTHINQLLESNKMGATDLGKWMKEQKWTIPQGMSAIKVWQYNEIVKAFEKGK